jgi:hypothetical protein
MTFAASGKTPFTINTLHLSEPSIMLAMLHVIDGVVGQPLSRRTYAEKLRLFMRNLANSRGRIGCSERSTETVEVMQHLSTCVVGDTVVVIRDNTPIYEYRATKRILSDARFARVLTNKPLRMKDGRVFTTGTIQRMSVTPHRFEVVVSLKGRHGTTDTHTLWMTSDGYNDILMASDNINNLRWYIGVNIRTLYEPHLAVLDDILVRQTYYDHNVINIVQDYLR